MRKMISISEHCRKTSEQNCHLCENANCDDNMNPSIMRLKAEKADALKEREDILKTLDNLGSEPVIAAASVIVKNLTQKLKVAEEMQRRAEKQVEEIADQCQKFGAKLYDLEKVVMEALITIGGRTVPLQEMVDAVKMAKALGSEDQGL